MAQLKEQADVTAAVESEAELIARLGSGGFERLRVLVPIARVVHRYGSVMPGAPERLS